MAEKISIGIGLEGGDDVRKSLEEIVGGVDDLKKSADELGKIDATVKVNAEGADEAKDSIDGIKGAAEELGQTDAKVEVKAEGADETKTSIDEVKAAAEELGHVDATVKVGVEGADEAKASLDGVAGSAGEAKGLLDPLSQTATVVGTAFDGLSLVMARTETATDAIGSAFTKLGAKMTRSLGPLGVFARALGPIGIAAGVVAGALIKFGDSTADALNKLTASSAKLDLTAQNFDRLQKALAQTGISQDAILPGLQQLKETLSQGFFSTDVITGLQNFIAQLERMPDSAERTNLAMKTLGDALGAQVIAGLQTGTISAQNFAAALGAVTPATQQQIVEAAKYQQALNQLSAAWTEFKSVITPITTPVLEFLTRELKILRLEIGYLIAQWNLLVAAIRVLDASSLESQKAAAQQVVTAYKELTKAGEELRQGTQQTGQAAAQAAQQFQLVRNPFTGMPEAIGATNQALQQTGQAAAQAGQQGAQAGQQASQGFMVWDEKLGAITQKQAEVGQSAAQAGQQASQGFMVWDEKLGAITQKQAEVGQSAAQAGQQATSVWESISNVVLQATGKVDEYGAALGRITWDAISSNGVAAWNAVTGAIQGAYDWLVKYIDKALQLVGLKPSAPATGGGAGMARGGLLGGRGTGTSDSNLAWLSRGEYIMPARVVAQPGVASFLEALRRSGRIPGYAAGGSVGGAGSSPLAGAFIRAFDAMDAANKSNLTTMYNLSQSILAAGTAMDQSLLGIQNGMRNAIKSLEDLLRAPAKAGGGLLGGRGTGTSDSNLAWLSRGEYVMPASAVRRPGVLAFLEALRRSGRIPGFQEGGLSSGPNFPQGGWPFSGWGDGIKQMVALGKANNSAIRAVDQKVSKGNADCAQHSKEIEDSINIFWDALLKSSQGKGTGVSSGRNFPQSGWPFAAGGLMGGRGTGTSDSNLAWLSRGEHIMPARAVRQPGVLAFLEALRRSGGNLSRVLDGMGRFALGGMVPRAIPAFATGGLAGGMSNVTIQFPGLPDITGLRASSGAVDELRKAAALAQVRSGGRKPSRYS